MGIVSQGNTAERAVPARWLAPPGFCADALRPLMPQLQRDLQQYPYQSITARKLDEARRLLPDGPVRGALAIINRTVWWLRPRQTIRSPMLISLVHDLQELLDDHAMPDMELVVNVDDYPFVPRASTPATPVRQGGSAASRSTLTPKLPPPLFSFYQTRSHADLLCPSSSFREASFEKVVRAYDRQRSQRPWAVRQPRAFWQGHPYCGKHRFGRCSRYLLSHLSAQNAGKRRLK